MTSNDGNASAEKIGELQQRFQEQRLATRVLRRRSWAVGIAGAAVGALAGGFITALFLREAAVFAGLVGGGVGFAVTRVWVYLSGLHARMVTAGDELRAISESIARCRSPKPAVKAETEATPSTDSPSISDADTHSESPPKTAAHPPEPLRVNLAELPGTRLPCKLMSSAPLTVSDRVSDATSLGLYRDVLANGVLHVHEGNLTVFGLDYLGVPTRLAELNRTEISQTLTHPLKLSAQLGLAAKKSLGSAIGIAIVMFIIMYFRVKDSASELSSLLPLLIACPVGGLLIAFLFGFLPKLLRSLRRGSMTQVIVMANDDRGLAVAVTSNQLDRLMEVFEKECIPTEAEQEN